MNAVNADTFVELWKEFSNEFTLIYPDWIVAYERNSDWSTKFLGGTKSSCDSSPIGNFFRRKFPNLRYRTEDGSFDLSFSSAENYKQIPFLNRNKINHFDVKDPFYPTSYDIIIEIENDFQGAWREMTKLTWVRCPLKVLITYNDRWDNENDMLVQAFEAIISQSNAKFIDNPATEYLLIIGNNYSKYLNWIYYKFNSEGKLVNSSYTNSISQIK